MTTLKKMYLSKVYYVMNVVKYLISALVVQWIRIGDYGSSDSGSNPLEST